MANLQADIDIRGTKSAAIYSGAVAPTVRGGVSAATAGSDVMLHSGPGRLMGIVTHQSYLALSGVAVSVYDGTPVSGGPLSASGHVPLFFALGPSNGGVGASGDFVQAGTYYPVNMPFFSGLCINSRSGQVGATFYWTSGHAG